MNHAHASDTTSSVCDEDNLKVSISLDRASINRFDDKHINLHAILRNNGTEECDAAIALSVPEASGLIINPIRSFGDDWKLEDGSDHRSLNSISKPLNSGESRRFNVEIIGKFKKTSGAYKISVSTTPGQDAAIDSDLPRNDWRMIWVSDFQKNISNDPALRNCQNSSPIVPRNLKYQSGTTITPLTLSFDCEFGYTIFDVRIQGTEPIPQLRLQPRGSGINAEAIPSFIPYFATPEHKDSSRYTVVFKGLPKRVPGLKLVSISENREYAEETRELVPYDPTFSDQIRAQLIDAYESSIATNIIGPVLYVSGITSVIIVLLMLVPTRWAATQYEWRQPTILMWTLASVGLAVGTATLVSLSLFTVLMPGKSEHPSSTFVAGAILTLLSVWITLYFIVSLIRQRLHSKAKKEYADTVLPWWLQDPIHGPEKPKNALQKKTMPRRKDPPRRIFEKKRRVYRTKSKTEKVNWLWVYLLPIAGAMSIVSIAILTP
jgi:hypothetical protein